MGVGVAVGKAEGSSPGGRAGPPVACCLPNTKHSPTPGQRPHGRNFQAGAVTQPCSPASELCQQDTGFWPLRPKQPAGTPALTSRAVKSPVIKGRESQPPARWGRLEKALHR